MLAAVVVVMIVGGVKACQGPPVTPITPAQGTYAPSSGSSVPSSGPAVAATAGNDGGNNNGFPDIPDLDIPHHHDCIGWKHIRVCH